MLNIFSYLKVSQKNLGCFVDRQKIYGDRHRSADRRLRTTDLGYMKTWLRSHKCASDMQIRTASQKSIMKQEYPLWKSF